MSSRSFAPIYRCIWGDIKFEGLAPLDKYVFLYLLSHPSMTPAGTIELSQKQALLHTALEQDKFEAAITSLKANNMIMVSDITSEVVIVNYAKHNWRSGLHNQAKAVANCLSRVKDEELKAFLQKKIEEVWR